MTNPDPAAALRPRDRPRAGRIRVVIALLVVAVLAAGAAAAYSQRDRISDQLSVWQYEPSSAIESYAERSTMTDEGRFLFYASHPVIARDAEFNDICAEQAEDVGILGCYVHSTREIYLYDVTDERLDGLEDVVAAHEMLHAAWDRLDESERARLEPLLEAEAATRASDPDFARTLQFYADSEPGERTNELHSIIGTEFATVGPDLEQYYSRYFANRGALTALHDASNAVFVQQEEAIASLVAQIDELKAAVDADYDAYNAGYDLLNADIAAFNERADSGSFGSQYEFRTERDELIERQDELDAQFASIEERVDTYDGLVTQLEALNAEVAELNESINIVPRTEPAL